ncbi:hypothetical protein L227DRAFT_336324 [Lentinus tigrinus ALCF2SS1-6]|uniref:Uncharacterized protein n=1 Tax=Lentinus tigrinus ALCF2SS1-6 TaxID=1328759 RepID=A0A5C2RTA7_9APHY|nr:hypothetical protein L227DRAFT_336324 [Lentinus tigrinus ALCF2SS1-6]
MPRAIWRSLSGGCARPRAHLAPSAQPWNWLPWLSTRPEAYTTLPSLQTTIITLRNGNHQRWRQRSRVLTHLRLLGRLPGHIRCDDNRWPHMAKGTALPPSTLWHLQRRAASRVDLVQCCAGAVGCAGTGDAGEGVGLCLGATECNRWHYVSGLAPQ